MPRKLTGGESRENGMGIVCHAKEFGKITLEAGKRAGVQGHGDGESTALRG